MAYFDTVWYVNSVGHAALSQWAANTAYVVGNIRRQLATPTLAAERAFMCVVAGSSHASTEPTWTTSRGAKTTDNTVTWQEVTGMAAVNGDMTNTPLSSAVRSNNISLGVIVKNNAGTHLFICTTSGNAGAGEPSYSTTTGATTADNTATWTCIGAVGAFANGLAPHARLRNSLASSWFANGSKIFIGENSAETQAAAYSIVAGTNTSPMYVICHDHLGSYPPQEADVTTGALVQTTGNNNIDINGTGCLIEGVTFQCGSGAVAAVISLSTTLTGRLEFKNCSFQKLGTNASTAAINTLSGKIVWDNCTIKFGSTGDQMRLRTSEFHWRNTGPILASGSAVPARLMGLYFTGGSVNNSLIQGCDLSQCSGIIYANESAGNGNNAGRAIFENCKLHASATPASVGGILNSGIYIEFINCHSGDVNYDRQRYMVEGTQTTETTVVRSGGFSDGTTPISAKIVTNSNTKFIFPFEMQPIEIWNETVGSPITVKVEGTWGGGAVPNNEDIWIDVEYPGDADSPLSSWSKGAKPNTEAAAVAHAVSSESWGGGTTDFKMERTITPQNKGFIRSWVRVGKPSSTFYVDPKLELAA